MDELGDRIRFDPYTVDLRARELAAGDRRVRVQDQPLRLFVALLERGGDVATRDELCDALWPRDTYVEREAGLNTAVRKLRDALHEVGGERELIETVPRVGYRIRRASPAAAGGSVVAVSRSWLATAARRRPVATLGITGAVVATLALLASASDLRPAATDPMPAEPELRSRYVEARALLSVGHDLERARALLESILDESPEFAPGHAHLAEASARLALRSGSPGAVAAARDATARALRLDPESAIALRTRAMIALHFDRDSRAAAAGLARAIERSPDDPVTHLTVATYESILGRHDAAIAAVRRAVDLAPEVMSIRSDAGYFLLRAGRYAEAIAECEMVMRLDPAQSFGRDCLITGHARAGDPETVRHHAVRAMTDAGASSASIDTVLGAPDAYQAYLGWVLERMSQRPAPPAVQIAGIRLALGDPDGALAWLQRAAAEGSHDLVYVPGSASFEPLRGEAGYERLIAELGLNSDAS